MEFGQQYGAVALVLALLGAALWWLRRGGYGVAAGRRRTARQLEPLDRLALSPQHSLHLVRVGASVVLLACSPGGCTMVREMGCEPQAGGEA